MKKMKRMRITHIREELFPETGRSEIEETVIFDGLYRKAVKFWTDRNDLDPCDNLPLKDGGMIYGYQGYDPCVSDRWFFDRYTVYRS